MSRLCKNLRQICDSKCVRSNNRNTTALDATFCVKKTHFLNKSCIVHFFSHYFDNTLDILSLGVLVFVVAVYLCICICNGLVFVLVFIFASCLLIFDIFDEHGHCGEQCGARLGYLAREPHFCILLQNTILIMSSNNLINVVPKSGQDLTKAGCLGTKIMLYILFCH